MRVLTQFRILASLSLFAVSALTVRADSVSGIRATSLSLTCSGAAVCSSSIQSMSASTTLGTIPTMLIYNQNGNGQNGNGQNGNGQNGNGQVSRGSSVVAPEPVTALYFVGALLLIVWLERKNPVLRSLVFSRRNPA
jgi:hypothetical protein